MTRNLPGEQSAGRKGGAAGFSLIELMVAMAVFLIVSAASFTLFSRHETLLSQEQGTAGLNIGLRNTLAQLQLDVVNAGNGQIQGPDVPAWPVGVTIINSNLTAAQCFTAATFNASGVMTSPPIYSCFDKLNVVIVDQYTPPLHPTNTCTSEYDTHSGTALVATVSNPATGTQLTATQEAARFFAGDQILFVTGTSPVKYTTSVLTAAGAVVNSGANVQLTFGATAEGGSNSGAPANDPIFMTTNAPTGELSSTFCSSDWVLRLLPIEYFVNTNNTVNGMEDPQLIRQQENGTTGVVAQNVMMDQIISFKVGAATWNGTTGDANFDYCYNDTIATNLFCDATSTVYGYGQDYTLIRAVRATLIGRTTPSSDPTYTYRNPFDGGPYQIRGSSVVVDPRNLTMSNQ